MPSFFVRNARPLKYIMRMDELINEENVWVAAYLGEGKLLD